MRPCPVALTSLGDRSILAAALSRAVDYGQDGLKNSVGGHTKGSERHRRHYSFDGSAVLVAQDDDGCAGGNRGAQNRDDNSRTY
jgi:hypothetical protein